MPALIPAKVIDIHGVLMAYLGRPHKPAGCGDSARALFIDIAGDALVTMQGMSGLDVLAQGRDIKTCRGRGQVFEVQPEWQTYLDPLKPLGVVGC